MKERHYCGIIAMLAILAAHTGTSCFEKIGWYGFGVFMALLSVGNFFNDIKNGKN